MRCTEKDRRWLNRFFAQEEMWQAMKTDGTPPEYRYTAGEYLLEQEDVYVLRPRDGCVFVTKLLLGGIVYEGHTYIAPEKRGKTALAAGREAIAWMFGNTPCQKLVGLIPAFHRASCRFVADLGFRREGRLSKSYLRDGQLYDRIVFGLSKDEV